MPIIIGYPGIGKTTASVGIPCVVDLDSRFFSHNCDGWEEDYCNLAEYLSEQGKYVCISCHLKVVDYMLRCRQRIIVCYPSPNASESSIQGLHERLIHSYDKDTEDANYCALKRSIGHYDEDIAYLSKLPFEKWVVNNLTEKEKWLSDFIEDDLKVVHIHG